MNSVVCCLSESALSQPSQPSIFLALHTSQVLHDQEVLGKFCGQKNSTDYPGRESILSQSNKLSLIFRTSDSTSELQQHTGFSGVYKAIGRVFMITSPFSTILYFLQPSKRNPTLKTSSTWGFTRHFDQYDQYQPIYCTSETTASCLC